MDLAKWARHPYRGRVMIGVVTIFFLLVWFSRCGKDANSSSVRVSNSANNADRIGKSKPRSRYISAHPGLQKPLMPSAKGPLSGVTVFLDPGHGGIDPGAHWPKIGGGVVYEATITYKTAWELGELINANGGRVYYTTVSWTMVEGDGLPRDAITVNDQKKVLKKDTTIATRKPGKSQQRFGARFEFVNVISSREKKLGNKCFMLSIHVDSVGSKHVHGSHVCYSTTKSAKFAGLIADKIEKLGIGRNTLAGCMELRSLAVLSKLSIPGVLLELGIPANSKKDYERVMNQSSRKTYLEEVVLTSLAEAAR